MSARLRRLWFYFRTGYAAYFSFLLNLFNFLMLISLYLHLMFNLPQALAYSLMPLVVLVYVIAAVLVGWWHTRKQLPIELEIFARQNPWVHVQAQVLRLLVEYLETNDRKKLEEAKRLLEKWIASTPR